MAGDDHKLRSKEGDKPEASAEHAWADRRGFKRVRAPVYCRPVGFTLRLRREKESPLDVSLGGLRIYADDAPKKGKQLELELFLPDATSMVCRVEVMWTEVLPDGSPAKFDVGLRFVDVKDDDRERLRALLSA